MEIPSQAVPTRIKLISTLSKGERNLSDLSRIVSRDKTTVLEHLEKLVSLGLVARKSEPGRKWVFYRLTEDGREKYSTSTLVYSSLFLSALGAAVLGYHYFAPPRPEAFAYVEAAPKLAKSAPLDSSLTAGSNPLQANAFDIGFLLPILGLVLLGASLVAYDLAKRKKKALERLVSRE